MKVSKSLSNASSKSLIAGGSGAAAGFAGGSGALDMALSSGALEDAGAPPAGLRNPPSAGSRLAVEEAMSSSRDVAASSL